MKPHLVCCLLSLMITGVLGLPAMAQEKVQTGSPSEATEYLKIARAQTEQVRLQDVETGADIERVENPVFRYAEPNRGIVQGTMWVWGRRGRPAAVLELLRYDGNNDWFAFHATSDNLIKLTARNGQAWTPKSSELKFQPLPEAPPPADSPADRMRQMKEFSRRFSAHEIHRGRHELRVVTTPVHRYEDRDRQLIDGALFVIAHETALEATLFLEAAQRVDEATPTWQFAVGRSGTAEIVVLYDDKKVHHLPALEVLPPPPTESYWRMQVRVDKETSK